MGFPSSLRLSLPTWEAKSYSATPRYLCRLGRQRVTQLHHVRTWEPHGISFKPKVISVDLRVKELLGYTTYVLGNPMGFPSSLRLSPLNWTAKSYSTTPRTYLVESLDVSLMLVCRDRKVRRYFWRCLP
ncbi:hypothetical protein BHM03_00016125 [Ensete ventricosum]|nr:hypothetical protein BHM03_00016125 [Ensete ventricosum]